MAENIVMSEMSWTEVDEALKQRPVALVPVGATEAHGPHLPVSTDIVIASEVAKRGAAKLKEHGVACLILPPVPFVAAELGLDFAGTLSLPAETEGALLRDLAVAAAKRFRAVAFVNLHLEPQHMDSLKRAVEQATNAGASVCYMNLSKKRWADTLGQEFLAAEHAGAWETSLMMAAAPEMVRDSTRRNLAPLDSPAGALKKGAKSFVEAGGEDAYFGDPTAASAEDGEGYFDVLAEILSVSVMEHLGRKA
jgi:creatinine amidohydrolase